MVTTTAVAQGTRSQLLFKKQTALGTQATGNFTKARLATYNMQTQIGILSNDEIRSDREVQDERHGNRHGRCEIVTPLMYADHDTFIESALFNTFGSDSIRIGTDPQYLSMEDGALDVGLYRMGVNMIANSMSISVQATAQNPVRATFNFIGTDVGDPATVSAGGTPVDPSDNSPFDQFTGSLYDDIALSGDEVAVVTGMDFTIDNGVNPTFVIGQKTPPFLESGRGNVSGTLTAYYTDSRWLDRYLNETETSLVLTLTDPDGNSMEFKFPRVKFTGGDVPMSSEQSRVLTLPFMALREEAAGGSAIQITKA